MYQIIADETDFLVISKSHDVHFHSQDGTAGVMAQIEQDLGVKLYSLCSSARHPDFRVVVVCQE